MLCKLLQGMVGLPFVHCVVSLRDEGRFGAAIQASGVRLECLRMRRGIPSAGALRTLRKLVASWKPDAIQGWMYHGNLAATAAGLVGVPVLWNIRQSLPSMTYERPTTRMVIRLGALLSRHPARIIYNSRAGAEDHRAIGYDARRAYILPNGFDTDTFRPDPLARQRLLGRLGLTEDARLIGMFARLHPLKDHATLLRAATRIASSRPEAHLVLAGAGVVPEHPLLQEALADPILHGRVHALGEVTDVAGLTAGLDLATLSSRAEGFPNVLGEAMACGVPCVSTRVGDVAAILGDTGIMVPPESPEALQQAWEQVLDEPPAVREQRRVAARAHIIANYSLSAIVDRYIRLYSDLSA